MVRILTLLAAAVTAAFATTASAQGRAVDRRAALALIEEDFLREDSRVFRNREGSETVEASLVVGAKRYQLGLQRPEHHEHLLVIEVSDGARCPGLQTIIVGTRSGRIYHGVCQASVSLEFGTDRAYFEAELDRLLAVFQPLFAPRAVSRRGGS
jgi:hypothetical protein